MLEQNSMHSKIEVQESSASAFKHLCLTYHNDDDDVNENKDYVIKGVTKILDKSVKDPNVDITRGSNMMMGNLSRSIIRNMQQKLLVTVMGNMVPKSKANDEAEARKFAVRSQLGKLNFY